ncbi:hypothetical protein ACHWQZ_G016907 [Mnemiopsis leidyi]
MGFHPGKGRFVRNQVSYKLNPSELRPFAGFEYQFRNYFRRLGNWTLMWVPGGVVTWGIMKWCNDTYRNDCWHESKTYNVKE